MTYTNEFKTIYFKYWYCSWTFCRVVSICWDDHIMIWWQSYGTEFKRYNKNTAIVITVGWQDILTSDVSILPTVMSLAISTERCQRTEVNGCMSRSRFWKMSVGAHDGILTPSNSVIVCHKDTAACVVRAFGDSCSIQVWVIEDNAIRP